MLDSLTRTRFAPSPTGFLHVGGLRTALYSFLLAKKNGGQFILRLEDTDRKRSVIGATEAILDALRMANLEPDEGVVFAADGISVSQKGMYGPYIQSERLPLYQKYALELVEQGHAYYCFCTEERLRNLRDEQQANKVPSGYDGHCRQISLTEARQRVAAQEPHVIRLKMPREGETSFVDLIRGRVIFLNKLIDDQVLLKADGFPTYHLAVVVDDHLMQITDVVRGEEWLSSTAKHLQLYKYFGWDAPRFAHLPLLLNADKSKLSKRQGDVAVADYYKKGYLPEALLNFVAFLGWNPGSDKEMYSLAELIQDFQLNNVSKAGAVFNLEKLNWYNREYLKKISVNQLAQLVLPYFNSVSWWQQLWTDKLPAALALEKERVTLLSEFPEALKFIFIAPEYNKKILIGKKSNAAEVKKILAGLLALLNNFSVQEWNEALLKSRIGEWIKEQGYSNGLVLWPMRVALSGQENSPGPFEIASVLGREETLVRIQSAVTD